MKRILSMSVALAVAALLLASSVVLAWDGAPTIQDETFYVPSSPLTLGALGADYYGNPGYVIANEFQLNLLYQPGILDSDIANFNTYMYPANPAFPPGHYDGTESVNFPDPDEYVLYTNPGGGCNISTYGGATVYDPTIEWTLTGWGQTILAGDIVNNADGTTTLRVQPWGTYRPFPADPPVNDVEVFSGQVKCEVWGYRFGGSAAALGEGSEMDPLQQGQVVGWETYPVSKVRVLLPWIVLGAAIIAGASVLVLRRRRAQI